MVFSFSDKKSALVRCGASKIIHFRKIIQFRFAFQFYFGVDVDVVGVVVVMVCLWNDSQPTITNTCTRFIGVNK